jgi:hypothetical protein
VLNPEAGGRIELKLVEVTPTRVGYSVALTEGALTWVGSAPVELASGTALIQGWAPENPPVWLARAAHTALRLLWRDHHESGRWPRRICRWRPAPGQP